MRSRGELQTIVVSKDHPEARSRRGAAAIARRFGATHTARVHETSESWRFRQRTPSGLTVFRTFKPTPYIALIYGRRKSRATYERQVNTFLERKARTLGMDGRPLRRRSNPTGGKVVLTQRETEAFASSDAFRTQILALARALVRQRRARISIYGPRRRLLGYVQP